jgi:two-component system phosphate regulon response regulator PhoB
MGERAEMISSELQWLTPIGGSPGADSDVVPASLLLLSATGRLRPALLSLLDRDERIRIRPGALPQSVDDVDDADIVLIDASESVTAGIDTLVQVRRHSGVPVVLVAGEGAGSQAVLALDLGADDVAVEPFVAGEVPARIRSVLRRCRRPARPAPLTFGRLSVLLAEREVRVDGQLVETTPLEFDLLARLVAVPRRVFSRVELLQQVWGSSGAWQSPATVTEHIRRLRLKLEADRERPRWIRTVRGVGYRFEP